MYQKVCSVCHAQGKLGAAMLGDKKAWAPLIEKNMDVLIRNTIDGKGNMPPKGGCSECTNSDIIAAVKFMVNESAEKGDYILW